MNEPNYTLSLDVRSRFRQEGQPTILIILASLVSEGTPHMALDICKCWREWGINVVILTLDAGRNELSPRFAALGIPVQETQIADRGFKRWPEMARVVYRAVRECRARAVLSMPFGLHAFFAIGARLAGASVVVAHVGNHPGGLPSRTARALSVFISLGAPFTRAMACCSEYVRQGVIKMFRVSGRRVRVIYNGVDVGEIRDRAAGARRARATTGPRVVTMVARYEIHKDQPTLIRAAAELLARGVSVTVRLIGDGSRRAEFITLSHDLGIADRVELTGSRDDIPELLGASDVFAFATTEDEGLGIALIEAMAAGVPIVASNVGACRETLADGECGLLAYPSDPIAMADLIELILTQPETASARAEAAAKRAARVFSSEAMAAHYADVLLGRG